MFGFGKKCSICERKISGVVTHTVSDGAICGACGRVGIHSVMASVEDFKKAWAKNHRRFIEFNPTMEISTFGSAHLFVDENHQWFYFYPKAKVPAKLDINQEPIVVAFDEVDDYTLEIVGQKTVTKKKHSLARTAIGGALLGGVGAVVGAVTAKEEVKTKGGIDLLTLNVNIQGLRTKITVAAPPPQCSAFLDERLN